MNRFLYLTIYPELSSVQVRLSCSVPEPACSVLIWEALPCACFIQLCAHYSCAQECYSNADKYRYQTTVAIPVLRVEEVALKRCILYPLLKKPVLNVTE